MNESTFKTMAAMEATADKIMPTPVSTLVPSPPAFVAG